MVSVRLEGTEREKSVVRWRDPLALRDREREREKERIGLNGSVVLDKRDTKNVVHSSRQGGKAIEKEDITQIRHFLLLRPFALLAAI